MHILFELCFSVPLSVEAIIRHYLHYSYYALFATIRYLLFGFSRHPGKSHLITHNRPRGGSTLAIDSTDSFDSSNGHDPKPGCCRLENRISLLTTDLAVQCCRFDRFV